MSYIGWHRKTNKEAIEYLARLRITDSLLVINILMLRKQAYEAGERAGRAALAKELKELKKKEEKKTNG